MKSKYLKSLGLKKSMFVFLSLGFFFTKWISKKPKFDFIFFSSEKLCLRRRTWTPFFTTMIYVVFCYFEKNTAVCLWKKKDLFFFSSEKVWKRRMLWTPFFTTMIYLVFLFCKKHCSFFVKKKRPFFSHLKKFVLDGCTMIYVVFCSAKNTAVWLWKKRWPTDAFEIRITERPWV